MAALNGSVDSGSNAEDLCVNSVMLSYDLGFASWFQRQQNGLHGGRTYDQCQADSLRDGVSDRVMRFV